MFAKQIYKWVGSLLIFAVTLALPALQRSTRELSRLSTPVETALAGYSTALNVGVNKDNSLGSTQMDALVNDRRSFYAEYVNVALNLEYVGLTSEFITDPNASFTDVTQGDRHQVEITEKVTIKTKSLIGSPEEYPLVQSAQWAIKNAGKDTNLKGLMDYLQGMTESVKESLQGANIEFTLRHKLIVKVEEGSGVILQDSYDDKSVENVDGYDQVTWNGYTFTRKGPDFTLAPDYQFFHTSIDVLGKQLLEAYRNRPAATGAKQGAPRYTYPPYQHSAAVNYANTWVKNTTLTCAPGIPQNTANYNPAFTAYNCADCVNYVSQALHVGALQYDSTWQPYTTAWINVTALRTYLINQSRIYSTTLANLYPGDISMTTGYSHVVIYSAANPARFNGHSSDRYKAAFSQYTTLTLFYDVS